ncbi:MAG: radical SAM protein [Synergistaceae bacterium]|jgi:pyruvate formate lyase activating enzyme|nr:radical SAM protein [Synergistaceae bacterium]
MPEPPVLEPRWWRPEDVKEEDGKAHEKNGKNFSVCGLCFRGCRIADGGAGACGARAYSKGRFSSPHLGRFVSVAVDPIEKKPLRRWRPGTEILSLGGLRCNMRCPFCQNHAIAHPGPLPGPLSSGRGLERGITFEELTALAKRASLRSVAYTYNEPTLQAEYIFAASPLLREEGIATVMVTNGMFSEEVCEEAVRFVDAMNIDVKTFDGGTYERLGGSLGTVKRNVERLVRGGVHVELTHLVVPGVSDSPGDFALLLDWAAKEVSADIPLHISRYFPAFKYDAPPTDAALIEKFYRMAKGKLKHVYTGNLGRGYT